MVKRIVLTGGPCAGKTTVLSKIEQDLRERGYKVFIVSESATELIAGGITPHEDGVGMFNFQKLILSYQYQKEEVYNRAVTASKNDDIVIIYDRGLLDNKAYVSELEFKMILEDFSKVIGKNYSELDILDRYDMVIHLMTSAGNKGYSLDNNKARYENIEEAMISDKKTLQAWTGHPHLRVIDNSTDFENKMKRLIKEISAFLGEDEPYEIERKFLIEYPNLKKMQEYTSNKVEIIQTYLEATSDQELRLRQRGDGKNFIYTKTRKWKVNNIKRVEFESRISKEEYLSLLMDNNSDIKQIRKTRYCMIYENQYIEIDLYPFSKDKAILEIELNEENQSIKLPDFIKVIKEVTEDAAYKNVNLATSRTLN